MIDLLYFDRYLKLFLVSTKVLLLSGVYIDR